MYTDNNPFTYVLSTTKLNTIGGRGVSDLADFHLTIKYRPGKENCDGDGCDIEETMEKFTEEISVVL